MLGPANRFNRKVADNIRFELGTKPEDSAKQGLLNEVLDKVRSDDIMRGAGELYKAGLEACAAPKAGSWLEARPSVVFNMQLSNREVQYGVGRRLGCQLCVEGPCPLCLGVMDRFGVHCESCMVGGEDGQPLHGAG